MEKGDERERRWEGKMDRYSRNIKIDIAAALNLYLLPIKERKQFFLEIKRPGLRGTE